MNERDELLKTMVRTFLEKSGRQAYSHHRIDLDAMAAALDMCVEELLSPVSENDKSGIHALAVGQGWCLTAGLSSAFITSRSIRDTDAVLALRRAIYAPPKPKTQEEALRENLYAILAGTGSDAELYVRNIMEIIAELKQTEKR